MTVFVGPSVWRNIDIRTMTALMATIENNPSGEKVIFAPIWNDALIGRSRSLMCTEFLKSDADVMVIIDDDIVWTGIEDMWKIVEGARDTRGIYGAAYVTRDLEPHLTSRAFPGVGMEFRATPHRRPVEFQYLATGFFAIHRDVLEAMRGAHFEDADGGHIVGLCALGADRPFYPFFSPFQVIEDDGRRHYLSEDWAFCARARQLGFKVWADTSIILQHMGLYPYTVADIDHPGSAFPSKGIDRAEFESEPQPSIDPLVNTLIADIAEWAGEDIGDARRLVADGQQQSQRLFVSKPAEQTEAEWYRREDVGMAYICDLTAWHLRGAVPLVYANEELRGKRVYDFGCGIGTFALACARAGARVTTYEPNETMRDFLAYRALKYELPLVQTTEPFQGIEYDVINCWHVFEHLEDPEGALDSLLAMLAPGGVCIFDDGFDDHNTAQHHHHDDWKGVLASRGLEAEAPGRYRVVRAAVPV